MPPSSPTRTRAILSIAAFVIVVFTGIQFIGPRLTNPPVLADLQAPPEVKHILVTSCYNCHSNETKLPWFDRIVPAYWLVVSDVNRGRAHMNFSDFGSMPEGKQRGFLYESLNQMENAEMPPRSYRAIHREAKLTGDQIATLKNYLRPSATEEPTDAAQVAVADAQYQKWISTPASSADVASTANGLEFFADYQSWKPVSTTDRWDNNALRVILGNEVATRAIADGNIHPWPDGAAFAKIAWKAQTDANGAVSAGEFLQVEFMFKDAQKYAKTEGWGFGRWRGVEHTPYGKDASFTAECVSCHAPMRRNDFVFTLPITDHPTTSDSYNRLAALSPDLPYQPFSFWVIASSVDRPTSTMSTLYGNDIAVAHARKNPQGPYPAGAILSLVTWHQQSDFHWFGGRIPGPVKSVEYVTAIAPGGGQLSYAYDRYEGTPLSRVPPQNSADMQARIQAIVGQRASVIP